MEYNEIEGNNFSFHYNTESFHNDYILNEIWIAFFHRINFTSSSFCDEFWIVYFSITKSDLI